MMEIKETHLDALYLRKANEVQRLKNAKTEAERTLRQVYVNQIEREIADELEYLGIEADAYEMTDDELLAALNA